MTEQEAFYRKYNKVSLPVLVEEAEKLSSKVNYC